MTETGLAILLVEDNPADARIVQRLVCRQFAGQTDRIDWVTTLAQARERLEQQPYDLGILDLGLPDADGLAGLVALKLRAPEMAWVILTAQDDQSLAREAIAQGAQDYLIKGKFSGELLERSCRYALERTRYQTTRDRLRQEQELSRLRHRLISFISHELRSPLTVIRLALAPLLQPQPLTRDRQQHFLGHIRRAVDTLERLTEGVLLLNRADQGAFVCRPEWLQLRAFVEEVQEICRLQDGDRHPIAVHLKGDNRLWGDPLLLRHILLNLLSNALKYSPHDSTVDLCLDPSPEQLRITVRDRGIGFTPEELPHLFQPFWRSDRTEHCEGIGLGLMVVQSCVQAYGGRTHCESSPQGGTTFTVDLPTPVHPVR